MGYELNKYIHITDKEVDDIIHKEYARQFNAIELIPSENFVSDAVLAAMGSCLQNKYAEGYPSDRTSGREGRYYGGCQYIDELEELCCDRWRRVFHTDYHVNVQPHSGSQANAAVYMALLDMADYILMPSWDLGAHLTHGSQVNFSGKLFNVITYNADENGNVADIQQTDGIHLEKVYQLTSGVVHNSKGVELPSTGGEGSYWLITIGTLMAIGFAVFLITHKKMSIYTD